MPDFLGNLAFLFLASSKPEYNRKFDEATIIISKNTNSMGVIETIQFINKELEEKGKKEGKAEGKKEGKKEGKTEAKIEAEKQQLIKQLQRIHKALQEKIPIGTIALIEDIPTQFVKDFKKHISKETLPLLIQQITKLYKQIKADTPKKTQQKWLIQLWLKQYFSEVAIATFLKVPIKFVTEIKTKGKK